LILVSRQDTENAPALYLNSAKPDFPLYIYLSVTFLSGEYRKSNRSGYSI